MKDSTECLSSHSSRLEDRINRHIVDSAIEVHRNLGGLGLLESVYEEALVWELEQRELIVERQVDLPIFYKGTPLSSHFPNDQLTDGKVIVECKAVSTYNSIFKAQILTYLRLTSHNPLVKKNRQYYLNYSLRLSGLASLR